MGIEGYIGYGVAIITSVSTVVVSIRNSSKDADSRAKGATIESQDRQIKTIDDERVMLRKQVDEATGKASALEAVVTQAPQIVELTKVVTDLALEIKNQTHAKSKQDLAQNEQNKKIINLLTQMVEKGTA